MYWRVVDLFSHCTAISICTQGGVAASIYEARTRYPPVDDVDRTRAGRMSTATSKEHVLIREKGNQTFGVPLWTLAEGMLGAASTVRTRAFRLFRNGPTGE